MLQKMNIFVVVLLLLAFDHQHVYGDVGTCCGEGGVKVPSPECLLSWQGFIDHIANVTWLPIFDKVFGPGTNVNPGLVKPTVRWEILPDLRLRKHASFWANGQCIHRSDTTTGGGCSGASKLEYFMETDDGLKPTGRGDRLVSSNPDMYVIFWVCLSEDALCGGVCTDGFIGVAVENIRHNTSGDVILNEIPWCQIEMDLNRCFNMSIESNSNGQVMNWISTGIDCSGDAQMSG